MQRTVPLMSRTAMTAFLILISMFVSLKAQDQTVGLFINDSGSFNGYTLLAPTGATAIYLIDNYGRLVHSWESSYRPGLSTYLLENGNLLRTCHLPEATGGGSGGKIQEIAWDGTILWDFQYYSDGEYLQHHDVERLPNGNVLIVAWEYKTSAEAIAAGRDPNLLSGSTLRPEHIVEVEPTGPTSGDIVWEWHLWDHLIQDYDPSKDNYGVVADHPELVDINFARSGQADWIHANAVDYDPELDQIIICCHNLGEIWVIDHSTTTAEAAGHTGGNSGMGGDIIYRWGNPQAYRAGTRSDQKFFNQHDAHWTETGLPGEGNILVFNNGLGRPEGNYSSVDEFAPPVDGNGHYPLPAPGTPHGPAEQLWIYTADPPEDFSSWKVSGAQRLPNSNTLICAGASGWFFEITPAEDIVWEYINPVAGGEPVNQGDPTGENGVFRCYRYPPDHPGLAGHDLTPSGPIEMYPVNISGTSHFPSIPSVDDSVVVTTTMTGDGGVAVAELYVDTGNGFFAMTLFDDGNHHDNQAGDDLYGAVIPSLPESTAVSYYAYAEDGSGSSSHDPPNPPRTAYGYTVCWTPRIYINEFMASNESCCTDEFGDHDDWIELYNAGSEDINLLGMYLTNDPGDPTQFMIGDTIIPAGGFIVFWADEETGQGLTHANFILDGSGDAIGLFDVDEHGNRAIDTLTYSGQETDVSYGRSADGGTYWMSLEIPTPGATNDACDCGVWGDVNNDGQINPQDVTYMVQFVYFQNDMRTQPPACPLEAGDIAGCNGQVNPQDVTYYVQYVYMTNDMFCDDPCAE